MGVVAMRWLRRVLVCGGSLALITALLAAAGPNAVNAAQRGPKVWSPFRVPHMKSVPVHPVGRGVGHLKVHEPAGKPAQPYHPAVTWPAPGRASVSLAAAAPFR